MKKAILLISALTLTFFSSQAQYFHQLYGTEENEYVNDGINTSDKSDGNGYGHFMVGYHNSPNPGGSSAFEVTATYLKADGTVIFNQSYLLSKSGLNLYSYGQQCVELPNGKFAVVADYQGSRNGVSYLLIDRTGNFQTFNLIDDQTHGYSVKDLVFATDDNGVDVLYATGEAYDYASGRTQVFAVAFEPYNFMTPVIRWNKIYQMVNSSMQTYDAKVEDMEFVNQTAANQITSDELAIAGSVKFISGGTEDGLLAFIHTGTGVMKRRYAFWHTSNNQGNGDELFKALKLDGNDLHVCLDMGVLAPSTEAAYTKISLFGVPSASFVVNGYNYSSTPSVRAISTVDMQFRYNSSSVLEIFQLAEVKVDGNLGKTDWVVFKFQPATSVANQYTYGGAEDDNPASIELREGLTGKDITVNGMSIFGSSYRVSTSFSTNSYEGMMVKAYLSGQSVCEEDLRTNSRQNLTHMDDYDVYSVESVNTAGTISVTDGVNLNDEILCQLPSIATGSNSFSIPIEDPNNLNDVQISPNPMLPGVNKVSLTVESEKEEDVNLVVYDMMGRVVFNQNFHMVEGSNKFSFELPVLVMSKGMYTVRVSGSTTNKTTRLLVK